MTSNFTGSVTVSVHPIPNDFERSFLTIHGGRFTAASFQLPSGLETGLNTLTFGPTNQSEGILLLTSGNFTATASATIINSLFPQGFPVRGSYSGTFDFTTRRATVRSHSMDLFQLSDRVEVVRSLMANWVTWTVQGTLQHATNILGPWMTLSNTMSPHPIDTSRFREQYYRVRDPAP